MALRIKGWFKKVPYAREAMELSDFINEAVGINRLPKSARIAYNIFGPTGNRLSLIEDLTGGKVSYNRGDVNVQPKKTPQGKRSSAKYRNGSGKYKQYGARGSSYAGHRVQKAGKYPYSGKGGYKPYPKAGEYAGLSTGGGSARWYSGRQDGFRRSRRWR